MTKFTRNAAGTALALIVAGGVYVGTQTHRGETVEVRDSDAETRGPRFFAAPEVADDPATPDVTESGPDLPASVANPSSCILASPREIGATPLRVWACICEGEQCAASIDDPHFLGGDAADLRALDGKTIGADTISAPDVLCATDPEGCSTDEGAAPCMRPVADIPAERRPATSQWIVCSCWAAPYDAACK